MGVVAFGFNELQVQMSNIADRTSRGMREQLVISADEVRDLARLYAPVDKGALEEAIKVNSYKGIANRKVFTIEVDESMPDGHGKGGIVGDYAEEMHEGVYNLGLLSEVKQAANPDKRVGRKFLERALEDLEDDIQGKVSARVNEGVGH